MGDSNGSPSVAAPRKPLLSVRTSKAPAAAGTDQWTNDSTADQEPVSPTARLMEDVYMIVSVGLCVPVNLPVFSAGIESQLARYARFRSIQVADEDGGEPRWVCTPVNVEDHIIVPRLDPAAVAADADKAVEDYVSSLQTLPMDRSRPLWEFHFLDFPTSEATSTVVIRVNHSLGDGASLLTVLMSWARSAADPASLPAMPPQPTRAGAIYAPPARTPFVAWVWSYLVLAWHTVVDVSLFAATILFMRDPHSPFKRADDGEFHRKRIVHRSVSLDDVKFLKNAMNCTVNDVLAGVTSAALSRYYFRKTGDTRQICLRSILVVNTRPPTSLQTEVNMIESGKSNDVAWGNRLGYILLPFHLAMHDDPLAYIRKAKTTVDRKKSSLEVIFTQMIADAFLKVFGLKAGAFIFQSMLANTTIAFTTLSGPAEQVQICGHPVAFIAPSVYGPPVALIIHYNSYMSTIKVVLSVDEDKFPDYNQLLDDFVESLRLIKDAASPYAKPVKSE